MFFFVVKIYQVELWIGILNIFHSNGWTLRLIVTNMLE